MLKLEPREAGRVVFPSAAAVPAGADDELEGSIVKLRQWRHYAD